MLWKCVTGQEERNATASCQMLDLGGSENVKRNHERVGNASVKKPELTDRILKYVVG